MRKSISTISRISDPKVLEKCSAVVWNTGVSVTLCLPHLQLCDPEQLAKGPFPLLCDNVAVTISRDRRRRAAQGPAHGARRSASAVLKKTAVRISRPTRVSVTPESGILTRKARHQFTSRRRRNPRERRGCQNSLAGFLRLPLPH